jgi:hypothetical protein
VLRNSRIYVRISLQDQAHNPVRLMSSYTWPKEAADHFDEGQSVLTPDPFEQPDLPHKEGGHPDTHFPEGYGLVSQPHWHGRLSQLAVHFQPTHRDMHDL